MLPEGSTLICCQRLPVSSSNTTCRLSVTPVQGTGRARPTSCAFNLLGRRSGIGRETGAAPCFADLLPLRIRQVNSPACGMLMVSYSFRAGDPASPAECQYPLPRVMCGNGPATNPGQRLMGETMIRTCVAVGSLISLLAFAPVPSEAAQEWRIHESVDPLDDSATITAVLDADTGPRFVAVCTGNETRAFIEWDVFLGSGGTGNILGPPRGHKRVKIRVGAAEAVDWYLPLSNSSNSTFVGGYPSVDYGVARMTGKAAPPRQDAKAFLRSLVHAERPALVVQTVPYRSGAVTAVFDLTIAADAIRRIADLCGWSLD